MSTSTSKFCNLTENDAQGYENHENHENQGAASDAEVAVATRGRKVKETSVDLQGNDRGSIHDSIPAACYEGNQSHPSAAMLAPCLFFFRFLIRAELKLQAAFAGLSLCAELLPFASLPLTASQARLAGNYRCGYVDCW